ncbi:hypothetical protein AAKU52_002355 [Pedobacter sp. CG_S7]|uniref:hypothetical protein n=1 Tax=Pedobacter sp. CG_S7 TaxID=3143930 RepID=UPI00339391D9
MRTYLILFLTVFSFGCKRTMETECGTLSCPPTTNTISLSIIGTDGKPTKAYYLETYNTRTKEKKINLQDSPNYNGGITYKYRLFSNPRNFSSSGDNVIVLVKSESGKEFKLVYLVQGGKCACEVKKLSGPSILTID